MVRIHHLAWVDNLDAGAIVLVQRHEDWGVATADSSKYPPADSRTDPSRTNLGRYMMDLQRLNVSPGVESRVKETVWTVESDHSSQRSCRSFSS